jgi:glycosyltransferase involved in cell wall biosynthesis
MRLSIHTDQDVKDSDGTAGYSYSYFKMIEHFSKFTYQGEPMEILDDSKDANAQLFYMEPERYNHNTWKDLRKPDFKKFHDSQYKIQGTHIEATKVWSHWVEAMKTVDEIWVGNYFAKDAVLNSGIETPTYVFELGVDSIWKPNKREHRGVIKFLHIDSASPRKRADLTIEAFRRAFGSRRDVSLTLKYHQHQSVFSVSSLFEESNIIHIHETLSQPDLVKLYQEHDVLVYPTEGEGFGFIPLQALATGMPVITTGKWCSYEDLLGDNVIESKLGKTQHTQYYDGEVVLAEIDSLVHLMRKVVDNFDDEVNYYFNQAPSVYDRYNWQTRCDAFLESVVKRLGTKTFN